MPISNPLSRAIEVEIDRSSWRLQPSQFRHPFPTVLARQAGPSSVHLLLMLLRLGELTTPVLTPQSGVARLWPLLRYLHAIADTPGLRLRSKWKDVDAHQKAIASDDFGVGLGMTVLDQAFGYSACVDGREYLYRLAQLGLVAGHNGMPPKVGTMKMADFAAIDSGGKVHLIECKGTQHSATALMGAMADGQLQKQSLVCSSRGAEKRLIGQRLVVGTRLFLETAHRPTQVLIQDPAPVDDTPVMLESRIPLARLAEPAMRLDVARAIGAAGAERTAVAIAQSDRPPDALALEGPQQRQRAQAAFAEDEAGLESFGDYGDSWLGERVIAPLLEPLDLGGETYRYARLVKAVSKQLLAEIREAGEATVLFQQQYPRTAGLMARTQTIADGLRAAIIRPGISLTEIVLLRRRNE
ncbi:hypothetical protein HFN63_23265 [Rhizobium leguminosarum]|uniref:hypothetical protein n=1 Tax=Rhizobium leguminosarum TaxID=384 RepID=UPI001C943461|nr:hypothetical protein [Rhizobium leguminosarum]MBY5772994.1 hypothetical protein [Rhizobium leguminosarum]